MQINNNFYNTSQPMHFKRWDMDCSSTASLKIRRAFIEIQEEIKNITTNNFLGQNNDTFVNNYKWMDEVLSVYKFRQGVKNDKTSNETIELLCNGKVIDCIDMFENFTIFDAMKTLITKFRQPKS